MLISFSVANFKSIRDLQTLSMSEPRLDRHLEFSNVFEAGNRRLLKTAAIYGPNASGKSNVLEAMQWMRGFVRSSSKESQASEPIEIKPFLLSTETENQPSHFEIEFFLNGFEYRYGFEVTAKQVESEWLFRKQPSAKPAMLFTREGKKFDVSSEFFKEGKGLEDRTRDNALFLSVCAQFNGVESIGIFKWIFRFRSISDLRSDEFFTFTAVRLSNPMLHPGLLDFARKADPGISGLRDVIDPQTKQRGYAIMTVHKKRDAQGKAIGDVEFDLETDQSHGTQKFIAMSGPITHTLQAGSILIVDELDSRLHPLLTHAIVDLFHSPANTKNAQLIFAAHDVTLLDPERFRRDQIWFTEKDEAEATELYSLAEFEPSQVRADSKFSRQYLLGLFGAIPKLTGLLEGVENDAKK